MDEARPVEAWMRSYDAEPSHWSWGANSTGLYLCGWLDVPLDYTNASDPRIVRLAVTKYQHSPRGASQRTLVVEPGGPGTSGTNLVFRKAEHFSSAYTNSTFDVLGWDPRGVNASQPSIACFPYDADRDRYALFASRFYREVEDAPRRAMLMADAMNEAVLGACARKYRDVVRMLSTSFVARDLDRLREALGGRVLDGYFVSYGTGIGQIYASMFPERVGRLVLDGTEMVLDWQSEVGAFGLDALDNITASFHDGFLGECIAAGPQLCDLAKPLHNSTTLPTKDSLISTMDTLFSTLIHRPIPGYTDNSGPVLITYSRVVSLIYSALYSASSWPPLATAFYQLLQGDPTLISLFVDSWEYDPSSPSPTRPIHSSDELGMLVVCSDQYYAPLPTTYDRTTNGEQWYLDLWHRMVNQSEIGGDNRFHDILPCRQWNASFPAPKEVFRGRLNHTLSNPVLLVAETYDPATPLRNGRRLLGEMGENARLVVLDAFSHSSRDWSECVREVISEYVLEGKVPRERETRCRADRRPYRFDEEGEVGGALEVWQAHVAEMRAIAPRLGRRRGF